jgi:hypothetical protein
MTTCNTCPNLAECLKSGYCVEQVSMQQNDILLAQATQLWRNGSNAAAVAIDKLLELRIHHEDYTC